MERIMKAIVFGANGYIGRHLVRVLRLSGWEITSTDKQHRAWNNDKNYIRADLSQPADLEKLDWVVDFVFFFSGLTGTSIGFEKYSEYIDINEKGLLAVLEKLKASASPPRIIFPSSRLVYKGRKGILLREDAKKSCLSIYAVNKLAAEYYLDLYLKLFSIPYTIFRICVPYGNLLGGAYSYGTVGFFLSYAEAGKSIPIYGDGGQKRTFSHIEDICNQIDAASRMPESAGRIFNIAGGDRLSIRRAARIVANHFKVDLVFRPWPALDLASETGDTVFDVKAITELTGYACKHRLKDWVGRLNAGSKSTTTHQGAPG